MNTDLYVQITELLSGLALFLFGMKYMSENLQQAAGEKLRTFLDRCTKNKYVAVVFGALFTAFIQSSGATTVMEVSFVNAGLLTLEKSIGITFGANIGTTITSQLVAFKLTAVAPFIIFIGAAIIMFSKKPLLRKIAAVIFGFGALFQGINLMTESLQKLSEYHGVQEAFKLIENPVLAVLVGLIFTIVVQSSSVTVSVLVLLAGITVKSGAPLVTPLTCLYYILGANIGSCAPAVLASFGTSRNAKRTALIHVLFNVVGLVVFSIVLATPLRTAVLDFIHSISANDRRFVANADTLFKICQCLILLPCTGLLVSLSKKLIRASGQEVEDEDEMTLKYIGSTGVQNPSTVLVEVVNEITRMADLVKTNLEKSMNALVNRDKSQAKDIMAREKYIDYLSHRITEYMVRANQYDIPIQDRKRLGGLFHVIIDLERIGDHAINILESAEKEKEKKISFSDEGKQQVLAMYGKVIEIFEKSIEIFKTMDKNCFDEINQLEDTIDQMEIDCQEGHVRRMSEEKCSIEAGLLFTDLVIGLERIADHATNIAYSILPEKE
jgi:phosphate:Na+ symporter